MAFALVNFLFISQNSFGQTYCVPGTYNINYLGITRVQFGSIDKSSNIYGENGAGYSDYSYLSTNVKDGNSYNITINVGYYSHNDIICMDRF